MVFHVSAETLVYNLNSTVQIEKAITILSGLLFLLPSLSDNNI